jgi:hypothetical protein
MNGLRPAIAAALHDAIQGRPVIVFVPKGTDAPHWRQLLEDAEVSDVLTVTLDDGKLVSCMTHGCRITGPTGHLALQHELIGNLTGITPVDPVVENFDPQRHAFVLAPDPLDPPWTGDRELLGAKTPASRLVEHKTIIDSLWDLAGIERVEAVVCDLTPRLPAVVTALDHGTGVVISSQQRGARPQAGGEGIWWTQDGQLPSSFPALDTPDIRVRVMPLLYGLPCRIHGMTIGSQAVTFPPLELLSLPRPANGTFLWAGAVPARTLSPTTRADLDTIASKIGTWLSHIGHWGAFAIDGILTKDGYRPTELTTRLTSAFEGADPSRRVLLHAASLLARAGGPAGSLADLANLAEGAFIGRFDIYGASPTATRSGSHAFHLASTGLEITDRPADDGVLSLERSPRGWLLHVRLSPAALPAGRSVGILAPQLFELSDAVFGTNFGEVTPPFGLAPVPIPTPRGTPRGSYRVTA